MDEDLEFTNETEMLCILSVRMVYLCQKAYKVSYSISRIVKLWVTFVLILLPGIFLVMDSLFYSIIYKLALLLLFPILLWVMKFFTEGEFLKFVSFRDKLLARLPL